MADEERRLSVLSDNKSDSVFSPVKLPADPLVVNSQQAPEKPPRRSPEHQRVPPPPPPPQEQEQEEAPSPLHCSTPARDKSNSTLNVSFEQDCLHQEVGQDFFTRGKEKKRTPFKKMLSFGKGKKKRNLPAAAGAPAEAASPSTATLPRQPELRQPSRRGSLDQEFQHTRHFSVQRGGGVRSSSLSSPAYSRSRDNSGGSSSYSAHSRHSTNSSAHSSAGDTGHFPDSSRNSGVSSIQSGESVVSPTSVSPIGELEAEVQLPSKQEISNIDTNKLQNSDNSSNSSIDNDKYSAIFESAPPARKTSRGFYDTLGVEINFDAIPVKNEAVLDLTNETIIDLDGDIIKDLDELRILRGDTVDSKLSAKVSKEMRITDDCNKMMSDIERLSSPPLVRLKRENTPSPSFSEIDMLLGNITADLDNFNI